MISTGHSSSSRQDRIFVETIMALSPADETRLAKLKATAGARTQSDGSPRRGYTKNVAALRQEIAGLDLRSKAVDKPTKPA
jgi:hypothetical protein